MRQIFRARLDEIVQRFLSGKASFDEFQRTYSGCYADEDADRDFTPEEVEHYGAIHEKAEWTAPAPSSDERGVGWLDVEEFTLWLRRHRSSPPPPA